MPALLTHDYFGQDVIKHIGGTFFNRPDDEALNTDLRDAFLLGNQGPDPFFFTLFSVHLKRCKEFGSRMHHEKIAETMEAFRRLAFKSPEPQQSILYAYLLGFICHFTLDSTMHPFVYAQQYALCDAGVEGLDRRDGSIVHGQIEADLDAMVLTQRVGAGVETYDFTTEVLKARESTLELLDTAYRALALEVYAVDLPKDAFSRGVKDWRTTIKRLYSPRGIKRVAFGGAERIFRRHSLVQAISLRAGVGESCDFDNHEHLPWKNPSTGVVSDASFSDLFQTALRAAVANAARFVKGEAAAELTLGLDFEGAPCRS
jgi:hypothetical protein